MNFLGTDDREELIIQMTSMVNVVFILLSFFVLASRFTVPEQDVSMGYAETSLAAGAAKEDFPQSVPILLERRGDAVAITVGQARLPEGNFEAIRAKLAEINVPGIPVMLLADPALSVDEVSQAMDAVLSSPMKQLSVGQLRVATRFGELTAPSKAEGASASPAGAGLSAAAGGR